jgi:phage terminase small subunit
VKLTAKQEMFVKELIKGRSQREAYKLAYNCENMTDAVIDVKASELMKHGKVSVRYEELRTRLLKESEDECIASAKDVLKRWYDIAFANPNELIHHRRICCRHCFGVDHKYQWKDNEEYEQSVECAIKNTEEGKQPIIPSNEGGYGFDNTIRPHPKCPKCKGEGYGQIHASDTRDLSPQGLALYAGVKQTRDGFEIKMKDQDKALENIAKHLGMFIDKVEHNGNITLSYEDQLKELMSDEDE